MLFLLHKPDRSGKLLFAGAIDGGIKLEADSRATGT